MLTDASVRALLEPFGLALTTEQVGQLKIYLDLLLRWNRRINLTSIRNPEECVTRHFGESLYISRLLKLEGSLLDVGSGAGFPGMALKIVFPIVSATLLEPIAKKRAFLKEVARACGLDSVQVRSERVEEFLSENAAFETVTARAVGRLDQLILAAARCLKPGGRVCLWLSLEQLPALIRTKTPIHWLDPVSLPISRQRVIVIGENPTPAGD